MAQESRLFASDKLTDPNVRAICQDKYGYIWIGTRSGLNKFDGYRFTAYRHHLGDKALPSNYITRIHCDSHKQLWIGTREGLVRYEYATDSFIPISFGNTPKINPHIESIIENPNHKILIGTSGYGLYTIQTAQWQFV